MPAIYNLRLIAKQLPDTEHMHGTYPVSNASVWKQNHQVVILKMLHTFSEVFGVNTFNSAEYYYILYIQGVGLTSLALLLVWSQ